MNLKPNASTSSQRTATPSSATAPPAPPSLALSREEAVKKLEDRKKEIEALRLKVEQSKQASAAAALAQQEKERQETYEQQRMQAELARKRHQLSKGLGSLAASSAVSAKTQPKDAKDGQAATAAVSVDKSLIEVRAEIDRVLASRNDYYVLKVPVGSALAQIKVSYRRLAMMLHPDKCKLEGAAEAFQKVNASHLNLCKVLQHQS